MTKILNFALKIKGVVGRVAHAKSSDPATPPKIWNVHLTLFIPGEGVFSTSRPVNCSELQNERSHHPESWWLFLNIY